MWIAATTSRLILYLLHIKAVFIANLFIQRGRRGAIPRVLKHLLIGLFIASSLLLVTACNSILSVLLSPIGDRIVCARSVVLRWC